MHRYCAVITKRLDRVTEILNEYADSGYIDYWSIGGRYAGIIPIGKNCKDYDRLCRVMRFDYDNIPDNYCPYPEINNEDILYQSIARIRNLRFDELARLDGLRQLTCLSPGAILYIDVPDQPIELIEMEDNMGTAETFAQVLSRYKTYFLVVVDYHF